MKAFGPRVFRTRLRDVYPRNVLNSSPVQAGRDSPRPWDGLGLRAVHSNNDANKRYPLSYKLNNTYQVCFSITGKYPNFSVVYPVLRWLLAHQELHVCYILLVKLMDSCGETGLSTIIIDRQVSQR